MYTYQKSAKQIITNFVLEFPDKEDLKAKKNLY